LKQESINAQRTNLRRTLAHDGLIAVVVFVASYIGIGLIVREGGVSPVWISTALIVYFVLRRPQDEAPRIIFIGIVARFLAGLAAHTDLVRTLALSLRDLLEVLVVVVPLRSLGAYQDFTRRKTLFWFYAIAGGPAPLCAALISGAFLHYAH
jgi:integral membrane sensor domain MASE1